MNPHVRLWVGPSSVCHNFREWRVVTLPDSYRRSTSLNMMTYLLHATTTNILDTFRIQYYDFE